MISSRSCLTVIFQLSVVRTNIYSYYYLILLFPGEYFPFIVLYFTKHFSIINCVTTKYFIYHQTFFTLYSLSLFVYFLLYIMFLSSKIYFPYQLISLHRFPLRNLFDIFFWSTVPQTQFSLKYDFSSTTFH